MAEWSVKAEYDSEAGVWHVIESDVPRLIVIAKTLDAFERKIGPLILDLLEINADLIADKARLKPPHHVHIVFHHDRVYDIAA